MVAALLSALALASPHGWTLAHARHLMATRTYAVTDRTQPDAPRYELEMQPDSVRGLVERFGLRFPGDPI